MRGSRHEAPVAPLRFRGSGLTVVLGPAVSSDYIYLRVVALLSAVHPDQDVLEDAGRVDVCPGDVRHQGGSPRLAAHVQAPRQERQQTDGRD